MVAAGVVVANPILTPRGDVQIPAVALSAGTADSARALILLAGAVLRFAYGDDPDFLDDPDPTAVQAAESLHLGVSRYTQEAMARFLREGHLVRHIARMQRIYRRRMQRLRSALHATFGNAVVVSGDSTGLHLVAQFNLGLTGAQLTQRATQAGVRLGDLAAYRCPPAVPQPDACPLADALPRLVLGYGALPPEEIVAATEFFEEYFDEVSVNGDKTEEEIIKEIGSPKRAATQIKAEYANKILDGIEVPKGKKSGLVEASHILKGVNGIDFCYLTDVDVVRHEMVKRIIKAYDSYYRSKPGDQE